MEVLYSFRGDPEQLKGNLIVTASVWDQPGREYIAAVGGYSLNFDANKYPERIRETMREGWFNMTEGGANFFTLPFVLEDLNSLDEVMGDRIEVKDPVFRAEYFLTEMAPKFVKSYAYDYYNQTGKHFLDKRVFVTHDPIVELD